MGWSICFLKLNLYLGDKTQQTDLTLISDSQATISHGPSFLHCNRQAGTQDLRQKVQAKHICVCIFTHLHKCHFSVSWFDDGTDTEQDFTSLHQQCSLPLSITAISPRSCHLLHVLMAPNPLGLTCSERASPPRFPEAIVLNISSLRQQYATTLPCTQGCQSCGVKEEAPPLPLPVSLISHGHYTLIAFQISKEPSLPRVINSPNMSVGWNTLILMLQKT